MYTTAKEPLAKLHRYAQELADHYHLAIARRHFDAARAIHDRRLRVARAILIWQEWYPETPPVEILDRIQRLPARASADAR